MILKDEKTANGVTLEDIIASGVSLPHGARPPRGVAGVYAGDAESYYTFAPLLTPIVEEYHKASQKRRSSISMKSRLQRHRTNLSPQHLTQQNIDPKGEYILYTKMRLARCVEGFRFAPTMTRAERRYIENLLRDCISDWKKGEYKSVMEMTNSQHDDLILRRILFHDPDEFAISAGLGRDWPDARGLYCDTWESNPEIVIWCNESSHFSIISTAKGGDVQGVFTELSKTCMALETALADRGHSFEEDNQLGFLNPSPANIGTALRASVYVKLPRLSQQPEFLSFVSRLHLEARTEYSVSDKRFMGILDIANAQSLGKTEVELINIMICGVGKLIELEKRLEDDQTIDLPTESITRST
jgi:protein-arginine kinase